MKPYLLKVPLVRKDSETRFDTCQVDHVVTLSEQEFRNFQHNLLSDYDFLREFNREYAGAYTEGVRPGLIVLGEGSDDGIFVCTEGYDYARYSAYVPYARQLLLLKEYPSLQDYAKEMAGLVDQTIQKAVTIGQPEGFCFSLDAFRGNSFYNHFNEDLFLEMLGDRPEIEGIETDRDEVRMCISQDYLPKPNPAMRTISAEDFKVACAKHLLWAYGAGGEQADFSNCVFDHINFSGMELNSAIFDGAVFRDCNLTDASVCFASFKGCTFLACNCSDWTAEEAIFQDAVFDRCDLRNTMMTHSDFTHAVLQDCNVQCAGMRNCLTEGMRTVDTRLNDADLHGSTEDAPSWFHEPPSDLSMEKIQ